MLSSAEIVRSVYGAIRLARLDPIGMEWLDRSPEGCWRSFRVAILLLPLEIVMTGIVLSQASELEPFLRVLVVGTIAYVISWTVFPVLSYPLVRALGKEDRYPGFIAAINWSRVVVYAVAVPTALLIVEGPPGLAPFLQFAFYIAFVTYHWFIARTALEIPGPGALGFSVMQLLLLLTVDNVAFAMMTVAAPAIDPAAQTTRRPLGPQSLDQYT